MMSKEYTHRVTLWVRTQRAIGIFSPKEFEVKTQDVTGDDALELARECAKIQNLETNGAYRVE